MRVSQRRAFSIAHAPMLVRDSIKRPLWVRLRCRPRAYYERLGRRPLSVLTSGRLFGWLGLVADQPRCRLDEPAVVFSPRAAL
jgi:hypothetical protein